MSASAAAGAARPAPRLVARGVGLDLDGRAVLDAVDVDIRAGELVALIGPNGAGKSTLLHLLAGDRPPGRGEILLDDRPLRSYRALELARLRAVLTQSNDVSFPFTVDEVVEMGRAPWAGLSTADRDRALIERSLEDAELLALRARRTPELSGGERARAASARVRAQDGRILLLDEPTASLDIRHQERLLAQLRTHVRCGGGSGVVVLHDLNLAAAYADRVVLLEAGRIRADGAPAAALDAALLSEVYRSPLDVHRVGGQLLVVPRRAPAAAVPPEPARAVSPPSVPTPEEAARV